MAVSGAAFLAVTVGGGVGSVRAGDLSTRGMTGLGVESSRGIGGVSGVADFDGLCGDGGVSGFFGVEAVLTDVALAAAGISLVVVSALGLEVVEGAGVSIWAFGVSTIASGVSPALEAASRVADVSWNNSSAC